MAQAEDDEIIRCPVTEIMTATTTSLPDDWWDTPQMGRLFAVQVRQINGESVLTCLYRANGKEIAIMRRPPASAMACQTRASGLSFTCKPPQRQAATSATPATACRTSIQDRIAWDYQGRKRWASENLDRICENATDSEQPGVCFSRVMHGKVDHGGGTRWKWPHALKLCAGTHDAQATVFCFTRAISRQRPWREAIEQCRVKPQ